MSFRMQNMSAAREEPNVPDTAEQITISSLALLKMLKHGRAGVPMEVMGLMLGTFVDEYTINVVDVFAMPQSGTGVSVEAVDPVFQTKMMEMLTMTGRPEQVVGWYHSHPGFGCWLSGVDVNTQQSFESLQPRAVAVVVDPIQSVKGKVVIDAFRTIEQRVAMLGLNPREVTSNIGHVHPPNYKALMKGLNMHYYSVGINYRKTELEQSMLLNLNKSEWQKGFQMGESKHCSNRNAQTVAQMLRLAENYPKIIEAEEKLTPAQLCVLGVGKEDTKRQLENISEEAIENNVTQMLRQSVNVVSASCVKKAQPKKAIK